MATNLVHDFVPLLAANSDLDGLVHETCGDDDAMKLVSDATSSLSDWR